jgi:hypothetical protein
MQREAASGTRVSTPRSRQCTDWNGTVDSDSSSRKI